MFIAVVSAITEYTLASNFSQALVVMVLNKTSLVTDVPLGKDLTAMTDSFLQSACKNYPRKTYLSDLLTTRSS